MPNKPSGESLSTAKRILKIALIEATHPKSYDSVTGKLEQEIASALDLAEARGRAEENEACRLAVKNAAVNARAKYTCCLENGLNAQIIAEEAIRQRIKDSHRDKEA